MKRCRGGDGGGDRGCVGSIEDEQRIFLEKGREGVEEGEWSSREIFLLIFLPPFREVWVSKLTMVRASSLLQWLAASCLEDAIEVAVVEEMQDAEKPRFSDREVFIAGSENVRERVAPRDVFLRCSRRILSKRCMVMKRSEGRGNVVCDG